MQLPKQGVGAIDASRDRAFQLETVGLQIAQAHEVAFYSALFGVGASFEVFSLTILLTAVLLRGIVAAFIWVLIAIYLMTGIFFIAYASIGFRRTKRRRQTELQRLTEEYSSVAHSSSAPLEPSRPARLGLARAIEPGQQARH